MFEAVKRICSWSWPARATHPGRPEGQNPGGLVACRNEMEHYTHVPGVPNPGDPPPPHPHGSCTRPLILGAASRLSSWTRCLPVGVGQPIRASPRAASRLMWSTAARGNASSPASDEAGLLRRYVRRRPTLPRPRGRSTIGAERLNFRVRDGTGCFPFAMAAVTLATHHTPNHPRVWGLGGGGQTCVFVCGREHVRWRVVSVSRHCVCVSC